MKPGEKLGFGEQVGIVILELNGDSKDYKLVKIAPKKVVLVKLDK